MKSYLQYAQDVLEGRQPAGRLIKKAAERFFNLMEDERYEFKEEKADRVVLFLSKLHHYKGRHAGKPFILEPWQTFIIAGIYGFYRKEDESRLVSFVYIEMARKQGKSALAAGLCLYHLTGDGESGAEVYLAANSRDQAKLSSWPLCSNFAKSLDPRSKYLEVYRDMVKFDQAKSWLKVLASDSAKLDGPDPSMFLLDEYHEAKDTRVKDVLQSGQGYRENPMGMIITTAGFNKLGPCYKLRTMCVEILEGLKEDDTTFAAIYSLDEDDDWKDEACWIKSNPNLGVTVKLSYVRNQVQKAINSPSEEVGVRTKTINQWCDSENIWIPDHYILSASKDIRIEDYAGCDCYAGIDLSSTSDLTCAAFLFLKGGHYAFKVFFFLPEAALKEKRHSILYGEWRRMGFLKVTPGNVVDYDYILNDLCGVAQIVNIISIAYDSWNATQFTINAQDRGLPMTEFSQALGNFNRPTKEFERLMLSGLVDLDNNEIIRFCFRNVVMARDRNGNTKPSKQFEDKKIDGVIGILEALGAYLLSPRYDYSV